MTTYIGWTPPPGVGVVSPPVHPETVVSVIYSDAHVDEDEYLAHRVNWSSVGDGPSIVAYAVVEEYKPAPGPREWWLIGDIAFRSESVAHNVACGKPPDWEVIHVREVLPAAREVVAWAVVKGDTFRDQQTFYSQSCADAWSAEHGGTVVKLTGVMTC